MAQGQRGRPNNQAAIRVHVLGLAEAKAAFQQLPEIARDAYNNWATELTLREIVRDAKARVAASPSIQTRSLYTAIGWSLNAKSGQGKAGVGGGSTRVSSGSFGTVGRSVVRVKGFVIPGRNGSALTSQGARFIRPTRYAHLVEFGASHMPAEPFMVPAAKGQQHAYLGRCREAGRQIETEMAEVGRVGGRFL